MRRHPRERARAERAARRTRRPGLGWDAIAAKADAVLAGLAVAGRVGEALPLGASTPLGVVGFALAYAELLEQLDALAVDATELVHASSSGGTAAGLALGRALAGRGPRVRSIVVAPDLHPDHPTAYRALAGEAAGLLGVPAPADADVDLRAVAQPYGTWTREDLDAIRLLARTEGIVCDPVYSGRALSALVQDARSGRLTGPLVFWHTGGAQAALGGPIADLLWSQLTRGPVQRARGAIAPSMHARRD